MINIRNNKIFNLIARNYLTKAFSLYSLSQSFGAVVSFGFLALYTKYLPPAEYGKISLIWMFVLIASTLIDGRLNTSFSIKFYKVSKEENVKNIYSIFIYDIVVWGLTFMLFLVFPSLFQKIIRLKLPRAYLTILFFLIIFMILGNFYTNILLVAQRPKNYFIIKLIFNLTLIISTLIYLVVLNHGFIAYLESYLTAYIVISALGMKFFLTHYQPFKRVFSLSRLKELLKIGIPLIPDGLLLMFLTWGDRYILNLYVGLSVVGIYTIGYKFAEVINSYIVNPFGQALSPLIYKQFAQSLDAYKDTMRKVFKYYWIIISVIMIGYFAVLKEIFLFLIDVKYLDGYNITGIVLLGIMLEGAIGFLSTTIVVAERTGKVFIFTSISVLSNIVLNILLIPKYGIYGAAVATLIAYAVQFAMIFTYTRKLILIHYDYGFILKSTLLAASFFVLIFFSSYLKINILMRLGLKLVIFLLFILISARLLKLTELIKVFLHYEKPAKQAIG